jgi:hypothetical protein
VECIRTQAVNLQQLFERVRGLDACLHFCHAVVRRRCRGKSGPGSIGTIGQSSGSWSTNPR